MTIFTRIINGEIPSYKVAESDKFYAFLDINPVMKGHTLVVPKLTEPEEDYIFGLDDQTLSEMMVFAKRVAKAIEKAIECKRVGVAVVGLEVNHVHMHLIPINNEGDMALNKPKLQLTAEHMQKVAKTIADAFLIN